MFRYIFVFLIIVSSTFASQEQGALDTDEIYWNTPEYVSKLEEVKKSGKIQYVYHLKKRDFTGNWIIPLNLMPYTEGFSEIYENAIAKYQGREHTLKLIIPTLKCLWNDVIFLSPLHPHKHFQEYVKIGFIPPKAHFYKIPIAVLAEKRVTVWKWLSYKKYAPDDPIHDSDASYCDLDLSRYQELQDLPNDTKEFYRENFHPDSPRQYPPWHWYHIPHILCQDPIDITDERITVIDWEDPIE